MINVKEVSSGKYNQEELLSVIKEAQTFWKELEERRTHQESLGWVLPEQWASEEVVEKLISIAQSIPEEDAVLVLIGVGGSNNGARAAIEALKGKRRVVYAGNNLSAHYILDLLESLKDSPVYINVIAKNFETLEPGLSFRIFRQYLRERYGEDYSRRIFVTGSTGSQLHDLCKTHGFEFLTFPDDIGGRFSVLSDVGLFPMAFAGIDLYAMVKGASDLRRDLAASTSAHPAIIYASTRYLLYQKGYSIEMLATFEPRLEFFGKWWIQLFAESEGKDHQGLYPVTSSYSEDLHSVGQFVQDGRKILFETFLHEETPESHLEHYSDDVKDGFDYLYGKSLTEINKAAYNATAIAHHEAGIPEIFITLPVIDAYHLGQLFYFFMTSVSISGKLLRVNPYNQPGVESYKKHMFNNLGK